ncbi:MAG: DNA polymerase III subunit gamma/tau [Clostridia bacterium]|nr:DNA polymerase III subunit gamma/tau [Clostridia bacterium]
MGYKALYRAWRPEKFSDIAGQKPIVTTLVHQIETGHIAHAYLFCGSRGTGKTSTAKVLARAINCAHPGDGAEPCGECDACVQLSNENNMDVLEIDAASNNGVDEIRQLRQTIAYPPAFGRYKVYIIDEVHMLSTGAFNALLKTLEEPPPHAVFILATTEPQKLPATILSRCQRFDFRRIPVNVIVAHLKQVLDGEKRTADEEALGDIARAAEGGMRDALSILDMCLSFGAGNLTAETVREVLGTFDRSFMFDFAQSLIDLDAAGAIRAVDEVMRQGRDCAVFAREVCGHLRALMLAQLVKDGLEDLLEITREDALRFHEQAKRASREMLMRAMDLFINAENQIKWVSQPRTVVELAAVRTCHPEREKGDENLIERLANLEKAIESGSLVKKDNAKKEKKDEPKPEKKPKPVPAEPEEVKPVEGAEIWDEAKKLIRSEYGSIYPLVEQAVFTGISEDVMSLEFPKKWQMYYTVLSSRKKEEAEQAVSKSVGRPIKLSISLKTAKKSPGEAPTQKNIDRAIDLFGRENLVIADDERA